MINSHTLHAMADEMSKISFPIAQLLSKATKVRPLAKTTMRGSSPGLAPGLKQLRQGQASVQRGNVELGRFKSLLAQPTRLGV
jgi:hypothetical protein